MRNTTKVDDFMRKLDHPLKAEMEAVIKIIREASPKLAEDVKWGGPSFDYKEPMATINPRMKNFVAVIFHKGELLQDETGVLEAAPKGKAYVKLHSMSAINKHKRNLQQVVKKWIELMEKQ